VSHPAVELDDVVHQRVRLGILAVLTESRRADFVYLRDARPDGRKSFPPPPGARDLRLRADREDVEGRRPRTWVAATKAGQKAFATEVAAVRTLIAIVDRRTAPKEVRKERG